MTKLLIRSYTRSEYEETHESIHDLRAKNYVPWAIHTDGRVVYAPIAESRGTPPNGTGLKPYSTEVSKHRRNLCHSKLGVIALDRSFSQDALAAVSSGVLAFLQKQDATTRASFTKSYQGFLSGTAGYSSFDRLYDQSVNDPQATWAEVIKSLQATRTTNARIETLLAIHDAVGFQIIVANKDNPQYNKSPLYQTYMSWKNRMYVDGKGQMFNRGGNGSKGWYERDLKSEYKPAKDPSGKDIPPLNSYPAPSSLPGNITQARPDFPNIQSRTRATEWYQRVPIEPRPNDVKVTAETSGNIYYEQLDLRNELFGAGPSGSVCGALSAAFTFGGFGPKSELFKEYLFAIIGYLVGGGMHSLHEVLTPLRMLGLEYNTGTLLTYDYSNSPAADDSKGLVKGMASKNIFPLLPQKFLRSKQLKNRLNEHGDIAVSGGTHWAFNSSKL